MERPRAIHIKNKPTILMKNITSHKLNSAGFPDFSPNMSTMSAKMTKNSHKSKVGAKKTRSATNIRNRSNFFEQVGHENTGIIDLVETFIFSLYHVIVRPAKIDNNLKDSKILIFRVIY
jgi:predicted chitinase